ncbi:MAG: hypothetical protein IKN74_02730 [Clostridia bacterium]|nr:hypothetical protein [Clostridia bacterium]
MSEIIHFNLIFGTSSLNNTIDVDFSDKATYMVQKNGFNQFLVRKEFNAEELEEFLGIINKYKLSKWKRRYRLKTNKILNGYQWEMGMKFTDGTDKRSDGDGSYPEVWDDFISDMSTLFKVNF